MLSVIDVSRYNSFHHILAVTAYVFRCLHNLCKQRSKLFGPLTNIELTNARRHLMKGIQGSAYQDELAYLLKRQSKCPPLVRQLCLFLDD